VTLGYFDSVDEAATAYRMVKLEPNRSDVKVALVRDYLQRNLGCKKKEIIYALNLNPRTAQRAIKIIRRQHDPRDLAYNGSVHRTGRGEGESW
jgi:predicted transcriptional regulator